MRRGLLLATAMTAVSAMLGASPATMPEAPATSSPPPALQWADCPVPPPGSASVAGFRCATARVPMDHGKPDGDTFSLAVIKHPAGDPAQRIGTLFWNPGGPGDAGTQYLPVSIGGFPAEVLRRFDVVSWDPRGMGGRTTPVVQCFDSADAEGAFLSRLQAVPVSDAEFTQDETLRAQFNARCVQRNGDLLAHVSTADDARDLDLLRQAVGDERTSYYGTSYGTFLGATYLNMFPDKVRAAVLDGAVFPSAWAGGPDVDPSQSTFIRIGSDIGSQNTVDEFVQQCGTVDGARCAFSEGSVGATRRKWADLLARLHTAPAVVEGAEVDDRALVSVLKSALYLVAPLPGFDRFPGWAGAAQLVEAVDAASKAPATPATPAQPSAPTAEPASPGTYVTSAGRRLAVVCGESPNPSEPSAYTAQARLSYRRAGYSAWPFVASCAGWTTKAASPYPGPWDTPGVPVVVVGNTFDPATPYASSERTVRELADGHLLTVQGVGHTELLNPSRCAQDHITSYLVDGTVPPEGTTCAQDSPAFPPS
ncbi:alpha/beta hydrolase [Pseudonocardia sp.]|jgi:pimeloyl-ACP methyl ester carboxylesterase|uniref:alpha/beta hydrolase n=1 Tax=Pseudonocardia sp. TaxID=60912 RepID=UPI0031FD40C1